MRRARIFWLSWKSRLRRAAMQRSLSAPKWCRCGEESLLQPPCSLPSLLTPSFSDGVWQVPGLPGSRSAGLKARAPWGERADRGCGAGQEH